MRYLSVDAAEENYIRKPNPCAQCGEPLIAPAWSEQLSERRVRYAWECSTCDYEFETVVYLNAEESLVLLDAA
jgi:ribosomal protein L37AE/L43A